MGLSILLQSSRDKLTLTNDRFCPQNEFSGFGIMQSLIGNGTSVVKAGMNILYYKCGIIYFECSIYILFAC